MFNQHFLQSLRQARHRARQHPGFPGVRVDVPAGFLLENFRQLLANDGFFDEEPTHVLLNLGRSSFPINPYTLRGILERLEEETIEDLRGHYPDELLDAIARGTGVLQLQVIRPLAPRQRRLAGQFFPYVNHSWLDLERYGVYRSPMKEALTHCLLHACEMSGLLSQDILHTITLMLSARPFPKTALATLSEECEIAFTLTVKAAGRKMYAIPVHPPEHWPVIRLGLIEQHYFLHERSIYTMEDVEHWESRPEFPHAGRRLSSYDLIDRLMTHTSAFSRMTLDPDVFQARLDRQLSYRDIPCVDPIPRHCTPVQSTSNTWKTPLDAMVCFDIETDVMSNPNAHVPYAVSWGFLDEDTPPYFMMIRHREDVDQLGRRFLSQLYEQVRAPATHAPPYHVMMIAHNAQYDLQLLLHCCQPYKVLKTGTRMKTWKGLFHYHHDPRQQMFLYIRDSALMIPMPIKKFSKVFNLPVGKYWFPYTLYTLPVLEQHVRIPLSEIDLPSNECTPDWYAEGFHKGWLDNNDGVVQLHLERYAAWYCTQDVVVLRMGYHIYRQWMQDITGLDIRDHISLSHLAKNYMIKEGCFDGVEAVRQNIMLFMRQAVLGGRTMVRENRPVVIETSMEDQDVNSLYPTAMMRMPGFLKGTPQRLPLCYREQRAEEAFYRFLQQVDGLFVRITILSVGKTRAFPTLCRKDDDVLEWTNAVEGATMIVCKTTLEDLIQFHEITFTVQDGYFYQEGFNTRIRDLVDHVYAARCQKKSEGNPIQEAYKLLLNSFYGVTLTRPPEYSHSFVLKKDLDNYYARHYPWIQKFTEIGVLYYALESSEPTYLEVQLLESLHKVSNLPHVGAEILAWSKRHMNEIMYLAEDHDIPIYYTDTDSIHLPLTHHDQLATLYEERYRRTLFGKALGQCSSEWDEGVYAIKSYLLSKKIYCDVLTNGTLYYKMKGITNDAVLAHCLEHQYGVETMYQRLAEGKTLEFNNGLDAEGRPKTTFRRQHNGTFTQMEAHFLIKHIHL